MSPLASQLSVIVGENNVLTKPEDLIPYGFDGTAALKGGAGVVAFPQTTEQVAACVKLAMAEGAPVVTRGSGTGLSGGSVPSPDAIVLCTVNMDRILEVDPNNLTLRAQPGVITQKIDEA